MAKREQKRMKYFVAKSLPLSLKLNHTEAIDWFFVPLIVAI